MAKFSIPRFGRLGRKRALFLVAIIVLIGSIYLGLRSLRGPAEGDIYTPSQSVISENPTYYELNGEHITFNYGAGYMLQPPGEDQPSVLEYYTFKKSAGQRPGNLTLAVSVNQLTSDKIEENGAFRIRNEQPNIYTKRTSSINSNAFTIFKKKDGSETTAFTRRDNMLAAIAISGTLAASNQSETEFTALLNSWQWKNL